MTPPSKSCDKTNSQQGKRDTPKKTPDPKEDPQKQVKIKLSKKQG